MLLIPRTLLACALAVAGCDAAPVSPPPAAVDAALEDPAPPPGLQFEGAELIQLDTVTPEFVVPIAGSDRTIGEVLTSPRGKRRVELRGSAGVQVLAESGWNLPAGGLRLDSGEIVVCWNALLGPERSGGRHPHPTRGVGLRCRTAGPGGLTPVLDASAPGVIASWLQDLEVRDGQLRLRYLRDRTGWLVTISAREDGTWERILTVAPAGLSAGESTLVAPFGAAE